MKKLSVIFIIMSLFCISINAQVRVGVKAGVGASSIGDKKINNWNTKDVTSYYIGPTIELMIHEKVGIEGSLLYSIKGIKFDNNTRIRTSYLELPVNIKGLIPLSEKFGIYATAGPYVNVKISNDDTTDSFRSKIKAKDLGLGLNFGAGVQLYKHVQLGANYSLGLTDNYSMEDKNYSIKDRTWTVSTTILF